MFKNKILLISGGTVSFGNAVLKRFLTTDIGEKGDLMVKKSPACSMGNLVQALKELFNVKNEIKYIGVRLDGKVYKTLLTREESSSAINMQDFYRIYVANELKEWNNI